MGRELHSVRLFPKGSGADAYILTGIAARCDWVVLSDSQAPEASLVERVVGQPRTVFVSLRQPFAALGFFFDDVFPRITKRFVLITGSEDVTVPMQTDRRWRGFNPRERDLLERIRADARVIAWFAENLDTRLAKMHPLPTGLVPPPVAGEAVDEDPSIDLPRRPRARARILCCHRVREGPQWEPRRRVTSICKNGASGLCTVVEDELDPNEFVNILRAHEFVLCVEGGGLDPSPKAWQAILHGAIPIVRKTPASDAYRYLPVAFVDDWSHEFLDPQWLDEQSARLVPMFESAGSLSLVRWRLSLDYWWNRVCSLIDESRLTPTSIKSSGTHIMVLGMHRSGTSLLTAQMAACGADPGPEQELTGPNQHNPKGFWENNSFREINEQLLRDQNCEWDCPLGFDSDRIRPQLKTQLALQCARLLNTFGESDCRIFKDPRSCLTLRFWKSILPGVLPILVVRNPVEIALSLFRRNRMPLPIGVALWECYMLAAVRQSIEERPVICRHHDLIYQPVSTVQYLIDQINERGPTYLKAPNAEQIEGFVSLDLHRQTAPPDALERYLVADQRTVWDQLNRGELSGIATRELSAASRAALEGYVALGQQFSRVRHLERLDTAPK